MIGGICTATKNRTIKSSKKDVKTLTNGALLLIILLSVLIGILLGYLITYLSI